MNRTALVSLTLLAAIGSAKNLAAAPEADRRAPEITGGGTTVPLPAGRAYQPTEVTFELDGEAASVVLESLEVLDPQATQARARVQQSSDERGRQAVTQFSPEIGALTLQTRVWQQTGHIRWVLQAPPGREGTMRLKLRGAHRVVAGRGDHYAARTVDPGRPPIHLYADRLACQSLRTQQGLVLSFAGRGSDKPLEIVGDGAGLELKVPWKSGDAPLKLLVTARPFGGDSLLALDGPAGRRGSAIAAGPIFSEPGEPARPARRVAARTAESAEPLPHPSPAPEGPPRAAEAATTRVRQAAEPLPRAQAPAQPAAEGEIARTPADPPAEPQEPPAEPARKDDDDQDGETPWEFFTGSYRLMPPLLADPREASARLGVMAYDDDAWMDMAVGGDIAIVRKGFNADERMGLSIRGLIAGRLNFSEDSMPVYNTDFVIGLAGAYQWYRNIFELFVYHESSHLGDEILDEGRRERIDYSREALRLLWSRRFGDLRVYGGPTFNFRAWPEEIRHKLILQVGAEYRFPVFEQPAYAAVDLQSRQANDWYLNTTAQVGVELGDPEKIENRPRLFMEVFHGHSEMGQFWDDKESYVMWGLGYNF